MALDTNHFLARISAGSMAYIVSVSIFIDTFYRCNINLARDKSDYTVVIGHYKWTPTEQINGAVDLNETFAGMRDAVSSVIAGVCTRTEHKGLAVDDIYAIRSALEEADP